MKKFPVRNVLLATVAVGLTMLLCSCGHNAITYGDGVGFDFGVNPENCTMSMNLRYGKILSAVVRDNTEIELSGKVNADGAAGATGTENKTGVSSDGTLRVKIGRQINGAAVDLVEAGADADKVLESLSDPKTKTP